MPSQGPRTGATAKVYDDQVRPNVFAPSSSPPDATMVLVARNDALLPTPYSVPLGRAS
ncbi:hypothetical protein WOLCODRAFT_157766 [Wolfiporia cocos MD-104 SS10]|uniref:Uncharacterized protein n=1 Tax=Wolfiporia cocos (strain MD-104) TaxID=742152 RepID=A0A2H3J5W6_WOLCO|nr:hypothetical protein WOLCODRAFT_157766 [Wolfiporia cocos MD-104 SS10]